MANQEDAAAARLEHVLGRQGSFTVVRIEALALIAHGDDEIGRFGLGRGGVIDEHEFGRVVAVAVVIALMTVSRTAIAVQWRVSSSKPSRRAMCSVTACTKSSASIVL